MGYGKPRLLSVALATALVSGCASMESNDVDTLRGQLAEEKEQSAKLQSTVQSLEAKLSNAQQMVGDKNARIGEVEKQLSMQGHGTGGGALLPPNAKPGECYARVYIEPRFETVTRRIPHQEASEKIAATPPRYDWAEERVLVREASRQLKVIPARYDWVEERILVKEASEKLIPVPAVYRNESEKVLVRPAYTTWKKGRGPIERIDAATGEIMCLIEVPAQYKTITRHVVATPATTRRVAIPAEYKTVKKRVMVEGPKTVEQEIPAEYKTVKVRRLVEGPKEIRNPVQMTDQVVTETRMVSEGRLEWRTILCETNTTPDVVSRLQRALRSAGYNPGPIDGVVGSETMSALRRYQAKNGMASGKLTMEALRKLGVY